MTMRIQIEIQGLAACYRQGSFWQIVFICDDWHPVNFSHTHNKTTVTSNKKLRRKGRDRTAVFDFNNAAAPLSPFGFGFERILNMAGQHLHGVDAVKKAKVKRKRSGSSELIFMLIPDTALSTLKETDRPYYVEEENDHSTFKEIGKIASIVGAEITLENGTGGVMMFHDGDDEIEFPYRDGDEYVLTFDNDCGMNCSPGKNDFTMFYDWLKDRGNENKRFIAGKTDGGQSTLDGLMSGQQGNCDPVVVDPPPGGNEPPPE